MLVEVQRLRCSELRGLSISSDDDCTQNRMLFYAEPQCCNEWSLAIFQFEQIVGCVRCVYTANNQCVLVTNILSCDATTLTAAFLSVSGIRLERLFEPYRLFVFSQ